MADISSIQTPSGTTLNFKDATARNEVTSIVSGYVKGISISGKTVTITKGDGTTSTQTTQDTTYSAATTSAAGLMSAADKAKIDKIFKVTTNITILAKNWSSASPYTQTIAVPDITADLDPEVFIDYPSDISSDTIDTYNESFYAINKWETGTNQITCTCYGDKPTVDLKAIVKVGVLDSIVTTTTQGLFYNAAEKSVYLSTVS